ncbi:MAG: GrpB family protein [Spirochaetaceae bacterium]|nr:GrpB family protein [Spirochaetaceae bacterium]
MIWIGINYLESFQTLGYRYLGECGRPGRYFFTYNRTTVTYFHLHIVKNNSGYWQNLVSFRDKLRYLQHKLYLADNCGDNRRKYREEKEKWFSMNNLQ